MSRQIAAPRKRTMRGPSRDKCEAAQGKRPFHRCRTPDTIAYLCCRLLTCDFKRPAARKDTSNVSLTCTKSRQYLCFADALPRGASFLCSVRCLRAPSFAKTTTSESRHETNQRLYSAGRNSLLWGITGRLSRYVPSCSSHSPGRRQPRLPHLPFLPCSSKLEYASLHDKPHQEIVASCMHAVTEVLLDRWSAPRLRPCEWSKYIHCLPASFHHYFPAIRFADFWTSVTVIGTLLLHSRDASASPDHPVRHQKPRNNIFSTMANTHLDTQAQPHLYTSGPTFGFSIGQEYALRQEMMLQRNIQSSQLLSPIQQQRHDSLFDTSPSTSPRASVSPQQHQAVPQPSVSAAQPPSYSSAQHPVNMQRSGSHYSAASGQHRQRVRQQRYSVDHTSQPGAAPMSRTSTQQSRQSIGSQYQAGSQPRDSTATSAQAFGSLVTTHIPATFGSHSWPYTPSLEDTLDNILEGKAVGLKGVGQTFHQDTICTE